MATAPQIGIRLTPEDLAILEALHEKLGIGSRTDIVRLAIRRLAQLEGLEVPSPKKKRSK